VCKYKITKKHLYEKHLLSKNHLKRGEALALPHPVNPEIAEKEVVITSKAGASLSTSANEVAGPNKVASKAGTSTNVASASVAGPNKVAANVAGTNVAANVVGTGTRAQNRPALKPPPSFPKPLNKALYEKATADFNKYVRDNNKENNETFEPLKDNETTTTTTITDESGNTIIEKTTYSTTNTVTDYDVHIDKADFIKMMATSINELKETGDKKTFVSNFFDYMFRHITEIRHSSVTNPPRNIMYDDDDDDA
jgi:hypothetical protein